jgi:hypothetical protein
VFFCLPDRKNLTKTKAVHDGVRSLPASRLYIYGQAHVGFSRPRAPKTCPQPLKSALSRIIKIVGFGPENPFRFTGPKHSPIVGGPGFPLRAL